jgi:hypothetical protein
MKNLFFFLYLWVILIYALLDPDPATQINADTDPHSPASQENIGHPHITQSEVRGLKAIVLYLHSLPVNKKGVPAYIKDPVSLVRDIRIIVEVHKNDRPERAVNGRPLLFWPGIKQESSWFMKGKRTAEVDREPASRVENDGKMYLSKRIFLHLT